MRKLIYVCSKYRGDIETNTQNAIRYCREVYESGGIPIAPHLYLTRFLHDSNPKEREFGLTLGLEVLRHCGEIWVFGGEISSGMQKEIQFAQEIGLKIVYKEKENEIRKI